MSLGIVLGHTFNQLDYACHPFSSTHSARTRTRERVTCSLTDILALRGNTLISNMILKFKKKLKMKMLTAQDILGLE